MFRKISYICMMASVLLSWGFMIYFANAADRSEAPQVLAARVANSKLTIPDYETPYYLKPKTASAAAPENKVKLKTATTTKTKTR